MRLDSGVLGNPTYQIERLLPGVRVAVILQIDRAEAERLVRWHLVETGESLTDAVRWILDEDGETFLDMLIDAAEHWMQTFPVLAAEVAPAAEEPR